MEIKIEDVMSIEEIKEIARESFITAIQKRMNIDCERILTNHAYHICEDYINMHLTNEQKELIKDNVTSIINNMTEYSIFRQPNHWDHGSVACDILIESVRSNQEKIKEKVTEIITNFNYAEKLESHCGDIIIDSIIQKLTSKE